MRALGKNWNDVNFPGALAAWEISDKYSKRINILQKAAAGLLLVDGCLTSAPMEQISGIA